ncbi:MAG: hypothetical protein KatS3mg016_2155 [Fimbriimonadales bacterium]|nr:MAG: hypothetical protein KatS3mg016_2155 [Fimbriimonadales bacterium]
MNHLIESDNTHLTIGGVVYCFWTRQAQAFNPVSFLSQPAPADVKRLIDSVRTGASAAVQAPDFYAVALSANSSRVVVRSYVELTVAEVEANIRRWFQNQSLIAYPDGEDKPLGVFKLATSSVPRNQGYSRPCARNAHPLRHYGSAAAAVAAGNGGSTLPRGAGCLLRTGKADQTDTQFTRFSQSTIEGGDDNAQS